MAARRMFVLLSDPTLSLFCLALIGVGVTISLIDTGYRTTNIDIGIGIKLSII
jgi:hypothetical protein